MDNTFAQYVYAQERSGNFLLMGGRIMSEEDLNRRCEAVQNQGTLFSVETFCDKDTPPVTIPYTLSAFYRENFVELESAQALCRTLNAAHFDVNIDGQHFADFDEEGVGYSLQAFGYYIEHYAKYDWEVGERISDTSLTLRAYTVRVQAWNPNQGDSFDVKALTDHQAIDEARKVCAVQYGGTGDFDWSTAQVESVNL